MTEKLLKLYRLKSSAAGYGETTSAVVYATSPEDAQSALAEAFLIGQEMLGTEVGYLGTPANPYEVEEVPFQRGVVLAEGQDG